MPAQFGTQLEQLIAESRAGDRVSAELPRARVEVARLATDSSLGFFVLDVRGFSAEEGRSMRAQYDASVSAWLACGDLWTRARREAEDAEPTAIGKQLAGLRVLRDSRFVEANAQLSAALGDVCEKIVRRAVVGWPAGELQAGDGAGGVRDIAPEFVPEPGSEAPARLVLSTPLVRLLAGESRALRLVAQIFAVSRGDTPKTALEQWAEAAAHARQEAAAKTPAPSPDAGPREAPAAGPFGEVAASTAQPQKGSRLGKKSPSQYALGSASKSEPAPAPAPTDSAAMTAPPVPSETSGFADAGLTGEEKARAAQ